MRSARTLDRRLVRWLVGLVCSASLLSLVACAPGASSRVRAPLASPTPSAPVEQTVGTVSGSGVPAYDHVFLIVMENRDYDAVIGSPNAPYINQTLAAGGTVFGQYVNIAHPSLPNYLALVAGNTFGVVDDNNPPDHVQRARNIVDLLEGAGKTWTAYMEDMPRNADVADAGPYSVHHNPFVYFSDITGSAARANRVVPYAQLPRDLASAATTPRFVWITPNMCHDMHDCSVRTGDQWLSQQVPGILGSAACKQGKCLLAVVWDEDEGSGHLPALFYGPGVRAGYVSMASYTHYSLLRTVEQAQGLATLGASDAQASPMTDAFSA